MHSISIRKEAVLEPQSDAFLKKNWTVSIVITSGYEENLSLLIFSLFKHTLYEK